MEGHWCLCSIKGGEVKVKVVHVCRGRFRVIEDEDEGSQVGKILDASDLIHCKFLPDGKPLS